MILGLCRRQARVSIDDGAINPAPLLNFCDGLDAGPHGLGSALVCTTRNEVVKPREQRFGQAHSNLVSSHTLSIPNRYVNWWTQRYTPRTALR